MLRLKDPNKSILESESECPQNTNIFQGPGIQSQDSGLKINYSQTAVEMIRKSFLK